MVVRTNFYAEVSPGWPTSACMQKLELTKSFQFCGRRLDALRHNWLSRLARLVGVALHSAYTGIQVVSFALRWVVIARPIPARAEEPRATISHERGITADITILCGEWTDGGRALVARHSPEGLLSCACTCARKPPSSLRLTCVRLALGRRSAGTKTRTSSTSDHLGSHTLVATKFHGRRT